MDFPWNVFASLQSIRFPKCPSVKTRNHRPQQIRLRHKGLAALIQLVSKRPTTKMLRRGSRDQPGTFPWQGKRNIQKAYLDIFELACYPVFCCTLRFGWLNQSNDIISYCVFIYNNYIHIYIYNGSIWESSVIFFFWLADRISDNGSW